MRKIGLGLIHTINYDGKIFPRLPLSNIPVVVVVLSLWWSLVEPGPTRLLRPVDPVFVDTLKAHMKRNPSRDVTPIVGLVQLPDGEEFQEDRKDIYLYETLGGNNSRAAMQELLDEEDLRFRTRLVSVYCHLTDNQALRLASKHNLATSVHHEMTTSDKVSVIPLNIYFHGRSMF